MNECDKKYDETSTVNKFLQSGKYKMMNCRKSHRIAQQMLVPPPVLPARPQQSVVNKRDEFSSCCFYVRLPFDFFVAMHGHVIKSNKNGRS